jgi:hypothetical protein
MNCPSCHAPMTEQTLEGRLSTPVAIDLCLPCQAFWFDGYESLRLAPGSVLRLFRLIGEQAPTKPVALAEASRCPRCQVQLVPAHDMQRHTRFQYLRCPLAHGRLITFFNFLREKDFIRPLSKSQIDELRRNVQMVNCSNCGAPVDLAAGSTCAHCGSPLSMLDMGQAQALVATLRDAEAAPRTVDPALPLHLEQARREVETAFAAFEQRPGWFDDVSSAGVVGAGLNAIARWLKDRY